MAAAILIMK